VILLKKQKELRGEHEWVHPSGFKFLIIGRKFIGFMVFINQKRGVNLNILRVSSHHVPSAQQGRATCQRHIMPTFRREGGDGYIMLEILKESGANR
jgi:hypothetical protein